MSQLMIIVIVVGMMLPTDGGQHPDCVDCPDGTGSMPLSPLSYNVTRSHIFNGTQPSNEGCTNADEQATVKCGQGTTLIDCDRGYNDSLNLSSYFIWNRRAQQVFIAFRFDQQINISRITMFFWNSPSNSIIIPNVRLAWADHNVQFTETTITTNSPNRAEDGQSILNISISNDKLKFLYLRIEMTFYSSSEWIFLSEVQFCGNTAPYHITQPSTDNDVQIVSPTATMATLTCSLNITIPSTVIMVWLHNNNNVHSPEVIETANTRTLVIRNFQTSDAGVYQCVFNDVLGSGWTLRRNTEVKVPQIIRPSTDDHRVDAYKSGSILLTCSLNINIPSSVTVTWISNNTVITTPIEIASTSTTLLIKNLQPSDAGVYQCVFTDAADGWTLRKTIILLITTPSIIHPPSDSQVITFNNSLSSVQLLCSLNVTVPSSMTVTWLHNGTIMPPNEVLTADSTTILLIRNPQPSDAGVYQCVFNDSVNGWMLRRNVSVVDLDVAISSTTTTMLSTLSDVTTTTTVNTTIAVTTTTAAATGNMVNTTSAIPSGDTSAIVNTATSSVTSITSVTDSTTITTIVPSTSTPTASPSISSSDTSSSSSTVGPIVAVIVVIILLVAIIVTTLVIIFIWRKYKKSYDNFDEDSEQLSLSVTGPSISEKDEAVAKDNQESSKG